MLEGAAGRCSPRGGHTIACYRPHPHAQDASRLVFVSVRDAKPKRKVAVPISDNSSWEQFCRQARVAAAGGRRGGVRAVPAAAAARCLRRQV